MLRERRRDESAWNGLGSAEAVRADLEWTGGRLVQARKTARSALDYIGKALALCPTYKEALDDRAQVKALLEKLQ